MNYELRILNYFVSLHKKMDNPFKIFTLMWHSRRPSKLVDMPSLRNKFWMRKGYTALTFFGTIITSSTEDAERMNSENNSLKRHEMIHLKQAQSLHDSWLLFYIRYLWYYLRALPQNRHMRNAAYVINPFEMEAYRHQDDVDYLEQNKDGANEWRLYAKMKPRERLKEYKKPTIKPK